MFLKPILVLVLAGIVRTAGNEWDINCKSIALKSLKVAGANDYVFGVFCSSFDGCGTSSSAKQWVPNDSGFYKATAQPCFSFASTGSTK